MKLAKMIQYYSQWLCQSSLCRHVSVFWPVSVLFMLY